MQMFTAPPRSSLAAWSHGTIAARIRRAVYSRSVAQRRSYRSAAYSASARCSRRGTRASSARSSPAFAAGWAAANPTLRSCLSARRGCGPSPWALANASRALAAAASPRARSSASAASSMNYALGALPGTSDAAVTGFMFWVWKNSSATFSQPAATARHHTDAPTATNPRSLPPCRSPATAPPPPRPTSSRQRTSVCTTPIRAAPTLPTRAGAAAPRRCGSCARASRASRRAAARDTNDGSPRINSCGRNIDERHPGYSGASSRGPPQELR